MKIIIYVLCYDQYSWEEAHRHFKDYSWARPFFIPTTFYMENVMYWLCLEQLRSEWYDADYVGTISWKAPQKMKIVDFEKIIEDFSFLSDPDVIALYSLLPTGGLDVLQHAQASHPEFMNIWIPLLKELGYSTEDASFSNLPVFFCNYWVAKPAWMDKYMEFFKNAKQVMDYYEPIQSRLWSDSRFKYGVTKERCLQIYGRAYFPYHAFICERLPNFFFWKEGAKLEIYKGVVYKIRGHYGIKAPTQECGADDAPPLPC
jgi:hypothetical protein